MCWRAHSHAGVTIHRMEEAGRGSPSTHRGGSTDRSIDRSRGGIGYAAAAQGVRRFWKRAEESAAAIAVQDRGVGATEDGEPHSVEARQSSVGRDPKVAVDGLVDGADGVTGEAVFLAQYPVGESRGVTGQGFAKRQGRAGEQDQRGGCAVTVGQRGRPRSGFCHRSGPHAVTPVGWLEEWDDRLCGIETNEWRDSTWRAVEERG